MEFKLHDSSESARKFNPINSPSNFKTVYSNPIVLDQRKRYLVGLDSITTMTYSWYNISQQYNNNKIKFGVLSPKNDTFDITYHNIEFPSASFTYDDINEYINEYIEEILKINLVDKNKDVIKIEFDFSRFKCRLTIKSGYVLDLRNSTFCNLIGFEDKLYGFTDKREDFSQIGIKTPNITNSLDSIYIHCDLVSNSLVDGKWGDVIYTLSTANLSRSYPFTIEPTRVGFSELDKKYIDSITIHMTDIYGKIIDLNGVDVSLYLIIKEDNLR